MKKFFKFIWEFLEEMNTLRAEIKIRNQRRY